MEPSDKGPELRLLDERIDAAVKRREEAKQMEGGGGSGMDAWQTSVENRLASLDTRLGHLDKKIDRNFLVTWAGLIAVALGLAGLMAKGFGWL